MIIDCTIGFNELDLFVIRYNELKDVVDTFLIVEATHTHRGTPKDTYFADWASGKTAHNSITFGDAFDVDRIEIITWDNGPSFCPATPEYAWVRENYQREIIGKWLVNHCAPQDLAILSDMDEIPSAQSLENWLYSINYLEDDAPFHGVYRFEQDLTYLYFNTTAGKWCGSKIFPVSEITAMDSARPLTDLVRYRPENMIAGTIKNGGWHFSSCFGVDRVRAKFDSYAHTEMSEKTTADIQDSLDRKVDPFHKNPMTVVDCNFLPKYVIDNLEYFKSKGCIANVD